MIITSAPLRDTRAATALTYVEISMLYRSSLEEALIDYPVSERHLRICALKIAVQGVCAILGRVPCWACPLHAAAARGHCYLDAPERDQVEWGPAGVCAARGDAHQPPRLHLRRRRRRPRRA
eukprot:273308-Prymnesium_polylepis.1